MRFVFVDEAGISEQEPVTVVVGIIVEPDRQLQLAELAISEILNGVPEPFRQGFVFHATDIWSNRKYRELWSQSDRVATMKLMMSLPRRLGLQISMGRVSRNADTLEDCRARGISRSHYQHALAFYGCLAQADRYLRNYALPNEVASVVAEDVPEIRRILNGVPSRLRDNPINIGNNVIPTAADRSRGYVEQSGEFRASRLRRGVHFVSKNEEPIIQIADACAFAFRRYFSDLDMGEELSEAMMGTNCLNRDDFNGPSSFFNYYFHPRTI